MFNLFIFYILNIPRFKKKRSITFESSDYFSILELKISYIINLLI